jgi:thioesterase domain-containing protein
MDFPRNDLEALVASGWVAVTGRRPGSLFEDFFLAGGDSTQATRLISVLRRELDRPVPLRLIFETPTVAGLAARLAADEPPGEHRYMYRLADGPGVPLVLAPGPSGGPAWVSCVNDGRLERPVYGLSSPGVHGECAPLETADEIARHLLATLRDGGVKGPVHLLGLCIGGLPGVAMAQQAADYGIQPVSVTLLCTSFETAYVPYLERVRFRLNNVRERSGMPPLDGTLTEADVPAEIERLFREAPDEGAVAASTLAEFTGRLAVFATTWGAAMAFRPTRVDCRLSLLYNPAEPETGVDQWASVAGGSFEAIPIPDLDPSGVGRPDVIDVVLRCIDAADAGCAAGVPSMELQGVD